MSELISKLNLALASATNENNLALANFNLDFSSIKVAAPAEYQTIGTVISIGRKAAAETG